MTLIKPFDESFVDYLSDESGLVGYAEEIAFPTDAAQVRTVLDALRAQNRPYTVQGARTGLVGGAVPMGGAIVNLSHCKGIGAVERLHDGTAQVEVAAGVTLEELSAALLRDGLFWPPQPPEGTATDGGVCATCGRGPNAFYFGDTAQYVLRRTMADDVLVSVCLRVLPLPETQWGLAFFFDADEALCSFVEALQVQPPQVAQGALWSVEYLDRSAMDLVEQHRARLSALRGVPVVPARAQGMLLLTLAGQEEALEALCDALMELAMQCGCDPDDGWAVTGWAETQRLNAYRHAAAECCNLEIAAARRSVPSITKLGSDCAFTGMPFGRVLAYYRESLREDSVRAVLFGHACSSHLHVNLLPTTQEEYARGREKLRRWASDCLACGGVPTVEHGRGKLKCDPKEEAEPCL